MAMRTTAEKVREYLGSNYDNVSTPKLNLQIRLANAFVNRVVSCATRKSYTHTSDELELLEMLLACHFYTNQDKVAQSSSMGGASDSFQGQTGQGLESSDFGQSAILADTSGCVRALAKGNVASVAWLGKPSSEALTYEERN